MALFLLQNMSIPDYAGVEKLGIIGLEAVAICVLWRALAAKDKLLYDTQQQTINTIHVISSIPEAMDRLRVEMGSKLDRVLDHLPHGSEK